VCFSCLATKVAFTPASAASWETAVVALDNIACSGEKTPSHAACGPSSALTRKALRPACALSARPEAPFNKAEYQWKSKPQFITNPSGVAGLLGWLLAASGMKTRRDDSSRALDDFQTLL